MNPDIRRILVAQGLRAFVYGFGSVLLGASLSERGWSEVRVGVLLTAVVAGMALMSIALGTFGERVGRRRWYAALFLGLAASGAVFGLSDKLWLLVLVALTGTLSSDVVESGPFTSLEQAMLPSGLDNRATTRVFGVYNAVAALVGSTGALAAGGPSLLRDAWGGVPADERFFLVFVPVGIAGALLASTLSTRVEATRTSGSRAPLTKSRAAVFRLSGLFALDALGGGFIIQSFLAYWFSLKFDLSLEVLGVIFFGVGLLQTASFLVATRLAERFGLLNTMVFTHLPSNVLLMSVPLAPTLWLAIALLFARQALSQMDVPTRQAYIALLVSPEERTAAAAYTNTARYLARPLGPLLAGAGQQVALGLPFFLGGGLKIVYDVALWFQFRFVPMAKDSEGEEPLVEHEEDD
ncbi:MAG: MFS transporter [Dehalococcoidia bacterium]